jgi:hypothetical protein
MKHAFMGLATVLGGIIGFSPAAHAQGSYAEDALLYSRQNPAGTARVLGLGGASVSLGGDFSNLTSNPAGLGFFTKSEFTLTPGVGFGTGNSTPVGNAAATGSLTTMNQTANSFHLANVGLVFASRRADNDNSSDWRGGSFALGFTRLADFNQGFSYQNQTDDNHSFFQFLREPGGYTNYTDPNYQAAVQRTAKQYSSNDYYNLDGLAAAGSLSNTITIKNPSSPSNPYYQIQTPGRTGPITQREQVTSKGSLSQFDLGYGGNYRDKLYIGLGVGVVSLNNTRTSNYSESSNGGEDFNYQDYLKTTGTGVNGRLGLIYRVADAVRLGASVQTPTYIRLSTEASTTLTSQYTPNGQSNVFSTTSQPAYEYSVTLPMRANGGLTVLLAKYGFLTGDIEYVNYAGSRFSTIDGSTDSDLSDNNALISTGYRNVVNFRVGAEGRFDIFRARLGYARNASPYAGTSSFNRDQNYYTAGLGIRSKGYFVDLAGVYMRYEDRYAPYALANGPNSVTGGVSPLIANTYNRVTVSLTGGLLF